MSIFLFLWDPLLEFPTPDLLMLVVAYWDRFLCIMLECIIISTGEYDCKLGSKDFPLMARTLGRLVGHSIGWYCACYTQ